MKSIFIKNVSLLFLIISSALFSTSFAGRLQSREPVVLNGVSRSYEEGESWEAVRHDEEGWIHDRVLKVKTNEYDYGNYDPAPAPHQPISKLIPH